MAGAVKNAFVRRRTRRKKLNYKGFSHRGGARSQRRADFISHKDSDLSVTGRTQGKS